MIGEFSLGDSFPELWASRLFPAQLRVLREGLLTHMLPALPDAEAEANQLGEAIWQDALSCPSDGSEDPSVFAEWVQDHAVSRYMELSGVLQGATNMAAVMLWHTLEQQMLTFLCRELLTYAEDRAVKSNPEVRKRLLKMEVFRNRLVTQGVVLEHMPSWPKLNELQLVANTVKHAAGRSADELYTLRPDLFVHTGMDQSDLGIQFGPGHIAQPAAGEDLFLTEADLNTYFDAAEAFWGELLEQPRSLRKGADPCPPPL